MICQRAEQDEALGADCVCVYMCVLSVPVELVPRYVLSVFVLMCLLGTHTEPQGQLAPAARDLQQPCLYWATRFVSL